jgi:predicted P-loop ATPase
MEILTSKAGVAQLYASATTRNSGSRVSLLRNFMGSSFSTYARAAELRTLLRNFMGSSFSTYARAAELRTLTK